MRTKWQSGLSKRLGFRLIGNGPEWRRTGTEAGNPSRTYAAKFTPYSATNFFFYKENLPCMTMRLKNEKK